MTVGDNMRVVELASIFFTKMKNSAHFGGYDLTLPEQWNKLTMPSILSIIRNLDPNNTSYVNWKPYSPTLSYSRVRFHPKSTSSTSIMKMDSLR